jgi:hypothetical protein
MLEAAVLVSVKMESLNEFSKSRKSRSKILLKIKRLIKNNIKIKKDILMLSELILFSENIIFVFKTRFGLTSL